MRETSAASGMSDGVQTTKKAALQIARRESPPAAVWRRPARREGFPLGPAQTPRNAVGLRYFGCAREA